MKDKARDLLERIMFFRDGDKTFFDPEALLWVPPVEAEWKVIRKELDSLLVRKEEIPNFQDISEPQKALTEGEEWKTFWFCAYGLKAEENCARCPETCESCKRFPG